MSAAALLADLASHGITLEIDGINLRYYAVQGALTPKRREQIREHTLELLTCLARHTENRLTDPAETRRQAVLDMLAENPDVTYAFISNDETDPEYVIITLAIWGKATCELRVSKARYDGLKVMDLIE